VSLLITLVRCMNANVQAFSIKHFVKAFSRVCAQVMEAMMEHARVMRSCGNRDAMGL
jgi:hypothetical protein